MQFLPPLHGVVLWEILLAFMVASYAETAADVKFKF